jgi:DNA-binding CsgD family transcriptional regulator
MEKVSYYKYDPKDQRHMLISLPRVKWLERDPDYRPPAPPVEIKEDRRKDARIGNKAITGGVKYDRPAQRSDALSPAQKQAWDLYSDGMSFVNIGVEMNRSTNAASKLVAQAKEKLGIGLEK